MRESFTNHPFCALPECFMGWMMRSKPASGEIFEPSTVVDRVDLAADTRIAIPLVLDLVKRQVIWSDIALRNNPNFQAHIEGNRASVAHVVRAMVNLVKPDLYTLFSLHGRARGTLVEEMSEADACFGPEAEVTPFDLETIMAHYLV